MAAYHAEETIQAAIQSLQDQTVDADFEVVVVDDCSTDRTLDRVREIAGPRVRILPLAANVGRAEARNIAIRQAAGSIIVVADADDVSLPGRLQFHLDELTRKPKSVVSGGQFCDIVNDVRLSSSNLEFPETTAAVDRFFGSGMMGIAHPSSAYLKSWVDDIGGYDATLEWCEDYDLFARGWSHGTFLASERIVVAYRRRTKVTSWAYWWENQRYLAAINERLASGLPRTRAQTVEIDAYLLRNSRSVFRAFELARYVTYRAQLALKPAPTSVVPTE